MITFFIIMLVVVSILFVMALWYRLKHFYPHMLGDNDGRSQVLMVHTALYLLMALAVTSLYPVFEYLYRMVVR